MGLLIKGGRVIDPANNIDSIAGIFIDNGKVKEIGPALDMSMPNIPSGENRVTVVSAEGKIVTPGLIDMHVHLREPEYDEEKETIETGTKAAARGGFTSLACMPNTNPVLDSVEIIEELKERIRNYTHVKVYIVGALTESLSPLGPISDFPALKEAGVIAFSNNGDPSPDQGVMASALIEAKRIGLPVISHCEHQKKERRGVVNFDISEKLGLLGIQEVEEYCAVERDIKLAEFIKTGIHIAHVSTEHSVWHIREAKKRGVQVTAEVTPHHFSLTEEAVLTCGANAKMNPPLRGEASLKAIWDGLRDGTIDVIATDHAPHTEEEKSLGLLDAPFGVVGLETAVPLVMSKLVHTGILSLSDAIAKMTINPARILGIPKGTLSIGADADVTVIDPDKEITVDSSNFFSKGRNTPFEGWKLRGVPVMTIRGGEIVYQDAAG